mmetsp:Transcript_34276/g.82900  ORF Transcript_34276/g.82900 Transcript_34276/m.82900 type:complete len:447 (-) Transcript_34276:359-1699(-)
MHYKETSQAIKWQLSSQIELNSLRDHANRRARDVLSGDADRSATSAADDGGDSQMEDATNGGGARDNGGSSSTTRDPLEVYGFSETRGKRPKVVATDDDDDAIITDARLMQESDPDYGPTQTSKGGHPLLALADESSLISFFCSKIPLLIGPHATLPRCRRDAKVAATACLLFRRFYLSNSVMAHDPKCMLAAAAFLATKVEDCMILAGYLEMGTKEMNAPVPMNDILDAEVKLVKGIDFDLLVFSPYKTVLSYTEDLRTFLKTDRGRGLISFSGQDGGQGQLAGEDLRPMHNAAMKICDDVIVSDIPMLFAPGEVGLAALMIANEYVSRNDEVASNSGDGNADGESPRTPQIDIMGYIRLRFQDTNESEVNVDAAAISAVTRRVSKLGEMVRELKEGKHGCGNYEVDMDALKGLNKKLKKCRAWGISDKKDGKKKKKKKRKAEET